MKKKLLGIIMAFCLIISTCALAACSSCNNDNNPPEGGAWWAKASVSGGTATLSFTSDTEWKLDCHGTFLSNDWNPWQSGTYSFDGKPGVSTLHMTATKESPNTFIKDKAVGEEATYEPTDGVYSIVFDVNGSDTTFSFKPPQDGTKPDGSTVPEVCTNHVDNNCDGKCDNDGCDETVAINHVDEGGDGKCDKCGKDMPAEKTMQVELKTDALGGGSIKMYSDNTFELNLTYGGKILEGTWAAASQTELTLTVDKSTLAGGATESPVGDTLTVSIDASAYPVITYTCNANYDASAGGQGIIPMTFTGTLGGQPAAHECKHVCVTCGKCTDTTCEDAACADKCEGHGTPEEKEVLYEVEAPVYAETMKATLKVYEDETWEVYFSGEKWCNGTWSKNNDTNALTFVRTNTESGVTLVGAESETVVYQLAGGKYTITMNFPSKDGVVFTINVGGENPTHECKHVCETCGKCTDTDCEDAACADKCAGHEVSVMATLSAEVSTIKAKIELKSNNTWTLSMCYYGDVYTPSADGRWSMNMTTYGITIVVENDAANMLAEDSYDLAINYETQKYSATIAITMPDSVPTIGGTALDFAFGQEAAVTPEKEVQKTLNANNGAQKAKIELYTDNTWEVSVCFYGDSYSPMASGTWALDTAYNITLTVTEDTADVLAEETYTLNVDYNTFEYSATITLTVPQVGALTFDFNSAVVAETHYTVTYDLNYTNAPNGGTATTDTIKLGDANKEYIKTAPTIPTREGYKFAGWYTVANPTLNNGASDKEYLFGTKLETTYNAPPAHLQNAVMEITENTTLYARWVEVTEIFTAAQLKAMANDLTGWYKLTADITLTEEWTPVGLYYANYEFYQPAWWLYSFRGTLDGNGHKISGLQLSTLDFTDNAVAQTEGSADGTTALFASAVNCTVKNLTIDGATVTITNYEANTHAYVSVLAAFVQGSDTLFEDCTIKNATVTVSTKNVWYVAVGGLFAGHWGGNAKNCDVLDSTISVTTVTDKILEGYTYEANYIGGLVGEGYAWMKNCDAKNVNVTYTLTDNRTTIGQYASTDYMGQPTQADVPVNVYLGGAMASSTYLQGVTYIGNITFNYTKAVGPTDIYFGGLSGLQRYGYIQNSLAKATMTFNNNNASAVTGQTFATGGILGGFDATMGLVGAMFGIQGDRITNCIDISTLTTTGTSVLASELKSVGTIPMDMIVQAIAPALGVDLTNFTRDDGTLNYFGVFNSVRVNGTASDADVDGNITVAQESDLNGEALKTTLGDGWTYAAGELPTPKTVA